jgi:hypothetical protein
MGHRVFRRAFKNFQRLQLFRNRHGSGKNPKIKNLLTCFYAEN